jgi:hypothetical protein
MKFGNEKEVTVVMGTIRRLSKCLFLLLSFFVIPTQVSGAQTPPKTIDMPQGGKIVYGIVDGAGTQAEAAIAMLRSVHRNCGERPQIAQVFKVRGTDAIGVFFTVVNHSGGNKQVAGLIVAAPTGPQKVEAAIVSDDAARFGSTANPMLTRLFSVWHPGSLAPVSGSSAGAQPASAGNGHSTPAASLHTVTAPDNSASIGIADGWQLDPRSASSTMSLIGPNGEQAVFSAMRSAVDPYNPQQVQAVRAGIYRGTGTILYPYHPDLGKAYPELLQAWRRALNLPSAKLQVDKIEPIQGAGNCVLVTGHIDADGQGMKKLIDDICQSPPAQWGAYTITRTFSIMTDAQSEQEQNTVMAMFLSVKVNQQVMNQQAQQKLAQKQQSDQQWRDWGQQQSDRIRAQGEAAQRNFADRQAANDAQHADWWAQQDSNARTNQGFDNYIRDQTVIRDVQNPDVHATVWNQTAAWMQQAFPDRIEEVPTSQYIKGQDF